MDYYDVQSVKEIYWKQIAAGRLELLTVIDRDCGFCPVCKSYEISNAGEKVHKAGCELARELGEQPADTEEE